MFKNIEKILFLIVLFLICSKGESMNTDVIEGKVHIEPNGRMELSRGKVVEILEEAFIYNAGTITLQAGHSWTAANGWGTPSDQPSFTGEGRIMNMENFISVNPTAIVPLYDATSFGYIQRPTIPFLHRGIDTSGLGVLGSYNLILETESIGANYFYLGIWQPNEQAIKRATMYDLVTESTVGNGNDNDNFLTRNGAHIVIDPSTADNSVTDIETVSGETYNEYSIDATFKVLANLGCKVGGRNVSPLGIRFGARHLGFGVHFRPVKRAKLLGNNSHYADGIITVEQGTTVIIGAEQAMPQSDIVVEGTLASGGEEAAPGVFTFLSGSENTPIAYQIGDTKTLTPTGSGQVVVPENTIVTIRPDASIAAQGSASAIQIHEDSTVVVKGGGVLEF